MGEPMTCYTSIKHSVVRETCYEKQFNDFHGIIGIKGLRPHFSRLILVAFCFLNSSWKCTKDKTISKKWCNGLGYTHFNASVIMPSKQSLQPLLGNLVLFLLLLEGNGSFNKHKNDQNYFPSPTLRRKSNQYTPSAECTGSAAKKPIQIYRKPLCLFFCQAVLTPNLLLQPDLWLLWHFCTQSASSNLARQMELLNVFNVSHASIWWRGHRKEEFETGGKARQFSLLDTSYW